MQLEKHTCRDQTSTAPYSSRQKFNFEVFNSQMREPVPRRGELFTSRARSGFASSPAIVWPASQNPSSLTFRCKSKLKTARERHRSINHIVQKAIRKVGQHKLFRRAKTSIGWIRLVWLSLVPDPRNSCLISHLIRSTLLPTLLTLLHHGRPPYNKPSPQSAVAFSLFLPPPPAREVPEIAIMTVNLFAVPGTYISESTDD